MTDEIQLTELDEKRERIREILDARNRKIWRLAIEEKKSQVEIAEMFGLSRQRVSKIVEAEQKRRGNEEQT